MMLSRVLLRPCCHGSSSSRHLLLPVVLRDAQWVRQTLARSYSSEHAHHEARIESIRNIGIIAHVDAGKTTTTERMLYYSGRTRHIGNVDHGNTTTDFLPMERERGITIQSAAITFQWPPPSLCPPGMEPKTINLIDTPGHQDFRYEVDRCLPILDGAVCILDSVKGVETHTERVWESAQLSKIPRLLFVNKLDRDGASFRRSVHEAASRLKTWPLLCQIPWWHKDDLVGVIDVIHEVGLRFSSTGSMSVVNKENVAKENPALGEEMATARIRLIETLSENDEQIMDEFLEVEKDVSSTSIKQAIRRLIVDGKARFTPVFAGASLRNIGVQPLLDAVVDYLPSPADRPPLKIMGTKAQTLTELLEETANKKVHNHREPPVMALAHVFKVVDDPRRGIMSWLRVYHGALGRTSHMWNSHVHSYEKPQHILHVSANQHHDIEHLTTGHIGAMTGLKAARTGDTLITFASHHTHSAPEAFRNLRIRAPETPPAVAFIAIEPYTRTASDRLEEALNRLSREDPSIRWTKEEKTGQLILSGMGLLHLEIAQDRLLTHYKIDRGSAMWGDIEVEYSECLLASTGPHRVVYDRVIRDKPGKAACTVTISPLEDYHLESDLPPETTSIERDGNIIYISIPLPNTTHPHRHTPNNNNNQNHHHPNPSPKKQQPDTTPGLTFDPDLVRHQLTNGIIAGLARGPRRSAPLRNCLVSLTFDPSTDWFGPATSTGGHITNAALQAVRGALKEAHSRGGVGILEPFSHVRIHCPEEAGHAIQHDLVAARGGQVLEVRKPEGQEGGGGGGGGGFDGGMRESEGKEGEEGQVIDVAKVYAPPDPYESVQSLRGAKKAVVRMLTIVGKAPLREMMKYDSTLRSITGGRHVLQLDQAGFELVTGARERALEER